MPKRVSYLYDKMLTLENCYLAEYNMLKNKKKKNKIAIYIKNNIDYYSNDLYEKLNSDTFCFHDYKIVYIKDSYKGKTRKLQIPCMEDQAAMQAWLNIAIPHLIRHNYYYNCGSIPNAGQYRAVKRVKQLLNRKKSPKWGGIADIRHFYETCPHALVMKGLQHIFKDKCFLAFAENILTAMNPTGTGLAIGYPVSHWFANVALNELDWDLCHKFPDVKYVRYMDDMVLISRNKRHLKYAMQYIIDWVQNSQMQIKHTWQIFPIKNRGISFLSYRFFHRKTVLIKPLMYRISRKMKKASTKLSNRMCAGVLSYMGILKYCNSYNYRIHHVFPYIDPKKCVKILRNEKGGL